MKGILGPDYYFLAMNTSALEKELAFEGFFGFYVEAIQGKLIFLYYQNDDDEILKKKLIDNVIYSLKRCK